MVRALVGTLLEVGMGNLTPEQFGEILERADDEYPFNTAPATGLRLEAVTYPPPVSYTHLDVYKRQAEKRSEKGFCNSLIIRTLI